MNGCINILVSNIASTTSGNHIWLHGQDHSKQQIWPFQKAVVFHYRAGESQYCATITTNMTNDTYCLCACKSLPSDINSSVCLTSSGTLATCFKLSTAEAICKLKYQLMYRHERTRIEGVWQKGETTAHSNSKPLIRVSFAEVPTLNDLTGTKWVSLIYSYTPDKISHPLNSKTWNRWYVRMTG